MSALLLSALAATSFVYVADRPLTRVDLAGSFNQWAIGTNPMRVDTDGRTWRTTLVLPPGKHTYKFVLESRTWVTDPRNPRQEDDGGGNLNSVLVVLPEGFSGVARPGDRQLTRSALAHDLTDRSWHEGKLTLRLRTRRGDAGRVRVAGQEMRRISRSEFYDVFRADIPWNRRQPLLYSFEIDGMSYGKYSADAKSVGVHRIPRWATGAVFYQIFPDRFANGNPKNDHPATEGWGVEPKHYNWMGGDLAGVSLRRNYLKNLGAEAIYFNPIFEGPANHGYETVDYLKVASHFGTNQELRSLVKDFRADGMRVILDGVFNHTATDFFAFKDLRQRGAASRYRDWYFPRSFPIEVKNPPNYDAWFGYESMPKVNLGNPAARQYMLRVPKFWRKEAGFAGWRLDVANEVRMDFWRDFRKVVKQDSDQWILGEMWGDARPWLKGDQWDSVMGYQFRDATIAYVADGRINGSDWVSRMLEVYESYSPQVAHNLMNLISSHDTPRFLTLCNGDQKLALLAATLQFTWPGSPSIYYGEELGLEGGKDPDNRRAMPWDRANDRNPFLRHYQKLTKLRRDPVLRYGSVKPLPQPETGLAAFQRTYRGESVLVIANRTSREVPVRLPKGRWTELLSGTPLTRAMLPPKTAWVLKRR